MTHRIAVAGLGITAALLAFSAFRQRQDRTIRWLSVGAFALILMQAGVGAMFVISAAAPGWGAAHVGFAAATWGALVVLSAIETLNTRPVEAREEERTWQPQSNPLPN